MLAAVVLGVLFTTAGLIASYALNLPSGAVIILLMAAAYVIALALKQRRLKPIQP